jgi:hypothetical protein
LPPYSLDDPAPGKYLICQVHEIGHTCRCIPVSSYFKKVCPAPLEPPRDLYVPLYPLCPVVFLKLPKQSTSAPCLMGTSKGYPAAIGSLSDLSGVPSCTWVTEWPVGRPQRGTQLYLGHWVTCQGTSSLSVDLKGVPSFTWVTEWHVRGPRRGTQLYLGHRVTCQGTSDGYPACTQWPVGGPQRGILLVLGSLSDLSGDLRGVSSLYLGHRVTCQGTSDVYPACTWVTEWPVGGDLKGVSSLYLGHRVTCQGTSDGYPACTWVTEWPVRGPPKGIQLVLGSPSDLSGDLKGVPSCTWVTEWHVGLQHTLHCIQCDVQSLANSGTTY